MVIADAWMAEAAMEGLDLSLVTDMLMLSATSPWTMYIAERNQVHLNPCSQQCNIPTVLNLRKPKNYIARCGDHLLYNE